MFTQAKQSLCDNEYTTTFSNIKKKDLLIKKMLYIKTNLFCVLLLTNNKKETIEVALVRLFQFIEPDFVRNKRLNKRMAC
jgi:hypothetical protein